MPAVFLFSVLFASCSAAVVPSLPEDTNAWISGMRSFSFIRRCVVRLSAPIDSAISSIDLTTPFCRSFFLPSRTPQYSFKNWAILPFLIGSGSASPRLSTFSAISRYSASHSFTSIISTGTSVNPMSFAMRKRWCPLITVVSFGLSNRPVRDSWNSFQPSIHGRFTYAYPFRNLTL